MTSIEESFDKISSKIYLNLNKLFEIKKLNSNQIKCKKILDKNYEIFNKIRENNNNLISNINLCKINEKYEEMNERKESLKNSKYFKCFYPKCDYKTKRLNHLKEHKRKHSNKKCFKCDFNNCKKMFKWKYSLITHKLIHFNNQKSFV